MENTTVNQISERHMTIKFGRQIPIYLTNWFSIRQDVLPEGFKNTEYGERKLISISAWIRQIRYILISFKSGQEYLAHIQT